jgi:hypothetical protein
LAVLGLWSIFDSQPLVSTVYYAVSLLFVALAAWHALVGRRTELIDANRELQTPLTIAGAIYAAAIIVADFVSPGGTTSTPFSLVNSIGLAAITFSSAMCGLRMALDSLSAVPARSGVSILQRERKLL